MEILLDEVVDLEYLADLCACGLPQRSPPEPRDRSVWHVTNLIDSARLVSRGENCYWEGSDPNGIMSMGRIWEACIDLYLADYADRRGGLYSPDLVLDEDGIVASLDGILFTNDFGSAVTETKLRFTMNPEIPMKHLQQVRAYCHLAKTDLVYYVSGHLSSAPPMASARMRVIRLTKQSIEETWEMIVNTKDYLVECGVRPNGKN